MHWIPEFGLPSLIGNPLAVGFDGMINTHSMIAQDTMKLGWVPSRVATATAARYQCNDTSAQALIHTLSNADEVDAGSIDSSGVGCIGINGVDNSDLSGATFGGVDGGRDRQTLVGGCISGRIRRRNHTET